MQIAMLGHKRIPSNEGGVEKVVEELAVRMVEQGHTVTCYNRSGKNVAGTKFSSPKIKTFKNVKLKYVFTVDAKGVAAVSSAFFASLCASFGKYDVVHVHAEGPALFCWLPKLFGKKVVVTVHGLDHQREKWGRFSSKVILQGEKNAVKYAHGIIVLSHEAQNYFMETYNRKTLLIPNGIGEITLCDVDEINQKFGLVKDGYILFLGRIVPEKGIKYLIDAYKDIDTDKKLVIAGGNSDTKKFFEEMKDLASDDDRIIFTDFVRGRLKDELFSNAYLYVLPSDLEGMPLSLLEAMNYGNCCITSDIPECADVLGDNGFTFKKSDTNDLKKRLTELINNPAIVDEYRHRVKQFSEEKLSWDDVTTKTLEIYRELCK